MATAVAKEINRNNTTPFHVKVFYRTETFHRLDEFQFSSTKLPQFSISTWPDCTLLELSHHVVANIPHLLPSPPIGTRLLFRLVFPDIKVSHPRSEGPGRYMTKVLGNIVIGCDLIASKIGEQAKPGKNDNVNPNDESDEREEGTEEDGDPWESLTPSQKESVRGGLIPEDCGTPEKTLRDVRFVIGDFVECAILPPLSNGDIAPCPEMSLNTSYNNSGPAHVQSLSGAGGRENIRNNNRGGPNEFIHPSRAGRVGGGGSWRSGKDDFGVSGPRPNGYGGFRDATNGIGGGGGGGGLGFRGRPPPRSGSNDLPVGEWRRGERVPDGVPRGAATYGYRGGRGDGRW